MPRASRRRRRTPAPASGSRSSSPWPWRSRWSWSVGRCWPSTPSRRATATRPRPGWVALADPVSLASARTGAQLGTLMPPRPRCQDGTFPVTARGVLQQGLDSAVRDTAVQQAEAENLASPPPEGDLASRFTQVMTLRAAAAAALRSTVDRLLGMQPLPVAGAPSTTVPGRTDHAHLGRPGGGRTVGRGPHLRAGRCAVPVHPVRRRGPPSPARMARSVWVPAPTSTAPLGADQLGAAAGALASSPSLTASHRLVLTSVGIVPPAVPAGGVGSVSASCAAPTSVVPTPPPRWCRRPGGWALRSRSPTAATCPSSGCGCP